MSFYFGNYGMNSLFGGSYKSNFYSSLGDYASIRSGSYKKLLTSYYAKTRANQTQKGSNSATKANPLYQNMWKNSSAYSYQGEALNKVKTEAVDLAKSASALTAQGSNSLFNEVKKTTIDAETGVKTTTSGYDMDAITKAVKGFVSDYNSAVEAGVESSNTNVMRNTQYMTRMTSIYGSSLEDVGITIGKDSTLSLDTDKLKSANIDTLKKVFNGKNSFAGLTASRAQAISQTAVRAASSASTYSRTGAYNMFYNSMSSWNWYL